MVKDRQPHLSIHSFASSFLEKTSLHVSPEKITLSQVTLTEKTVEHAQWSGNCGKLQIRSRHRCSKDWTAETGWAKLNVSNCAASPSGLVGFLGGHNFARRSSNCHSHGVFISFHRVMASNCRLPFFIAKQDTNQLGKRRSTVGFSNAVKLDFIFVSPHWCCRNLSHLASCDNWR